MLTSKYFFSVKTLVSMTMTVSIFAFALPLKTDADIGYYQLPSRAGAPFSAQNKDISLKKVNVLIKAAPDTDSIIAHGEFEFVNESSNKQDVIMGFPVAYVGGEHNLGIARLRNFTIQIGYKAPKFVLSGMPAKSKKKTAGSQLLNDYDLTVHDTLQNKFDIYRTPNLHESVTDGFGRLQKTTIFWKYVFSSGERQRIIIEYEAKGWQEIYYIVGTAGTWKGDVDEMNISVSYPCNIPRHLLEVSLQNYEYNRNIISWHFKNYKPNAKEQIGVRVLSDCSSIQEQKYAKESYEPIRVIDARYKLDKQFLHIMPTLGEFVGGQSMSIKSPGFFVEEVSFLRNEIFARHGYVFSTPKYKECFSKQPWYQENKSFIESELNYIEKRNINYLKCIENAVAKLPAAFNAYFKQHGIDIGPFGCLQHSNLLEYACSPGDSEDGEAIYFRTKKICDSLDKKYFELENKYIDLVQQCYEKYKP